MKLKKSISANGATTPYQMLIKDASKMTGKRMTRQQLNWYDNVLSVLQFHLAMSCYSCQTSESKRVFEIDFQMTFWFLSFPKSQKIKKGVWKLKKSFWN